MAESVIKDHFPSQTVSDAQKASAEYGIQVGKAIQQEWSLAIFAKMLKSLCSLFEKHKDKYSKNKENGILLPKLF